MVVTLNPRFAAEVDRRLGHAGDVTAATADPRSSARGVDLGVSRGGFAGMHGEI